MLRLENNSTLLELKARNENEKSRARAERRQAQAIERRNRSSFFQPVNVGERFKIVKLVRREEVSK